MARGQEGSRGARSRVVSLLRSSLQAPTACLPHSLRESGYHRSEWSRIAEQEVTVEPLLSNQDADTEPRGRLTDLHPRSQAADGKGSPFSETHVFETAAIVLPPFLTLTVTSDLFLLTI